MNEQWCSGTAECFECDYEWIAVWPLGADALECPECGSDDTDRTRRKTVALPTKGGHTCSREPS
ncbi:MAG: hydrogenase maturation nickel metallochaperone HypA [Betaproteobacteria bacterium]|nr:hydrogenase maturation nickel metallochaperone HypA [Betaproteobacteria bacterium]